LVAEDGSDDTMNFTFYNFQLQAVRIRNENFKTMLSVWKLWQRNLWKYKCCNL